MVNYQSPVTILEDYSAYPFLVGLQSLQPDLPLGPFNSGSREALSCHEWYIYVSLRVFPRWPPGAT